MPRKQSRGRPKESSYRVYGLVYARLLKGPLCLKDYRSTGIKSRATVHSCLKHLEKKKLVDIDWEGHMKMYKLKPLQNKSGTATYEAFRWSHYLQRVSRKEKRQIRRNARKTAEELKKTFDSTMVGMNFLAKFEEGLEDIIKDPANNEVYGLLRKAGIDWEKIPIPNLIRFLLIPNLDETLCLDCLKKGILSYLVFNPKTGETYCPIEGTVNRIEFFETAKSSKENPSPFTYDYDSDDS